MFKFETLEIWKESVKFTSEIYTVVRRFPDWETYNLTSQLTRATISISLNIAEGAGRKSKLDFKRFIQMAIGSLNEVVTCLYIARNQKYISDQDFQNNYNRCEHLSRMLFGFMNYLTESSSK